jgi:hypothetical protein
MTQQVPAKVPTAPADKILVLPPATMPVTTRVWAMCPWTDPQAKLKAGESVLWQLGMPHPFLHTHKIMRMFVIPGGAVEVYSTDAAADGKGGEVGTRHTLPWHQVLFTEEAMDAATFIAEIVEAEAEDDEEDEDDDPEPEPRPSMTAGMQPLAPLPVATPGANSNGGGSS